MMTQHICGRRKLVDDAIGRIRAVECDEGVNFNQVFFGSRSPKEVSGHGPEQSVRQRPGLFRGASRE